jgi:hypothetical protein
MNKALRILGSLAIAVAILSFPAGWIIESTATEAYMIAGKDPGTFQVNEELFDPPKGASRESKEYRDEVLRIYGVPTDETTSVVFWPKEKFIHPKQLPSITILPIYKEKGENPLQVKTVHYFASRTGLAAGVAGAVLLGLGAMIGKKKAPPAPPPAA